MEIGRRKQLQLCSLDESLAVYDAFLELKPAVMKKLVPAFEQYNFTTDLYGKKPKQSAATPYILTTKRIKGNALKTFGRKMVPQEQNVINGIPGNEISLVKRENAVFGSKGFIKYVNDLLYDIKGSTVLKILISDAMWAKDFAKSRVKK